MVGKYGVRYGLAECVSGVVFSGVVFLGVVLTVASLGSSSVKSVQMRARTHCE